MKFVVCGREGGRERGEKNKGDRRFGRREREKNLAAAIALLSLSSLQTHGIRVDLDGDAESSTRGRDGHHCDGVKNRRETEGIKFLFFPAVVVKDEEEKK